MHPKLAAARVRCIEYMPYLSAGLWKLRIIEVPDAKWPDPRGEIATTSTGVVLVRDALVQRSSADQLAAALAHEASHVVMDHFGRIGSRDADGWNWASDAAVNPGLLQVRDEKGAQWSLPYPRSQIVLPHLFGPGVGEGLSAEQYYDLLQKDEAAGVHSSSLRCGSAAGNASPAEALAPPPDGSEPDEAEWQATRVAVAAAVREHVKARGRGNVPAGLDRWAEEALTPSPIDWRRALSGAVRSELRRAGAWDFTYARPSRRRVPGLMLPSMRAPRLRAAIISDTSASRKQHDLSGDVSDVRGILRASGSEEVTLISVDCEVQGRSRVRTAAQAGRSLRGGGGTDMRPGFAEAVRGRERPDVIVVLTDGEVCSGWPDRAPCRTVIVVPEGAPETPAWARRVERRATAGPSQMPGLTGSARAPSP
jgi:predicted metal-dependent peptidase